MRTVPLLALLLVSGCRIVDDDQVLTLGQQRIPGYRIRAGSSTIVPAGDIGYAVTANGQGGYRVVWIDTAGSAAGFQGTITNDHGFEPNSTIKFQGTENVVFTSTHQIDFAGRPGATLEGVDFVSLGEPIYLDLTVDGLRTTFGIFFTAANSGSVLDSTYNPVAFTSP